MEEHNFGPSQGHTVLLPYPTMRFSLFTNFGSQRKELLEIRKAGGYKQQTRGIVRDSKQEMTEHKEAPQRSTVKARDPKEHTQQGPSTLPSSPDLQPSL